LGVGTRRLAGGHRFASNGLLLGPMVLLASIGARHWLPTYGATAPAGVLLLSGVGFSLGISIGLIGSGVLGWMLEGTARREGTATSAGAPPNARA